ncbi:XRE family transcriptional regulator [Rhodoferax sediminis]|jgi:transcriptional regulator with XRE-family HTH domain|uniref:XRE family transcriptional regulator n=1 Tax=Rhodoferax sediminis TaxID=2509614 RepID=A0A515DEW7_9BURK|nr:XRE family transcriptional regulator [Rhodoferax sediminis]QDL38954.1 XRE family transcriptional regulator [Rhodoferax sediminis]
MDDAKAQFAERLREAMTAAGYDPKPAVLEREFNTRYWGRPMTLHGVRRWLRGETLPSQEKLLVLAEWLGVPPQRLRFGEDVTSQIQRRRARWDSGIGYQDRDIFEAFLKLPVPQRKLIREVILTFAKVHAAQNSAKADAAV